MARFYETTVLLDSPFGDRGEQADQWGIQVLASSHEADGEPVDYSPLIALLEEKSSIRPFQLPADDRLATALASLADPEWNLRLQRLGEFAWQEPLPRNRVSAIAVGSFLLTEAPIAAEGSPVRPQSIAWLASEAGTVTYLTISGQPALVIAGAAVGLVVLRGLGAVGGALWRGAEPNVEHFGDQASAKVLSALAKRLNLD